MKPLLAILFGIFITGFFSCSSERNPRRKIEIENIEKFTIQNGRDTILSTSTGFKLHINGQTFKTSKAIINLEFASYLDKPSMVLAGLNTLSEEGKLLESEGMFWLNTIEKVSIQQFYPIRVKMPTSSMASKAKIFSGKFQNDELLWTEEGVLNQNQDLLNITEGKNLFMEYCTNCHNKNLEDDMTGPALGNIHLFRDSAYLVNFTRNATKVIEAGDLVAYCLYNHWNKSVMTAYEFLSDDQINNIYRFIESESRNKNFSKNQITYFDSCATNGNIVYTYSGHTIVDSTSVPASTTLQKNRINNLTRTYDFDITGFGWYNVDLFLDENMPEIENFTIDLENVDGGNVTGMVVFKNRKVIIPLVSYNGKYYLKFGLSKETIKFPLDEALVVIVFEEVKDRITRIGSAEIISTYDNNDVEIRLQDIEEKAVSSYVNKILQ